LTEVRTLFLLRSPPLFRNVPTSPRLTIPCAAQNTFWQNQAAQTIGLELIAATNAQLKSLTGAGSSSSAGAAGMEGGLGFFGS
jgi:hypothetical protein